jgi:hypothetical protein
MGVWVSVYWEAGGVVGGCEGVQVCLEGAEEEALGYVTVTAREKTF